MYKMDVHVDMYFIKGLNLMETASDHAASQCPRG